MTARLPADIPSALDAEAAVLGCLLLEGRSAMDLVANTALKPTDFYTGAHRAIFAAMRRLYQADRPVDVLTTGEVLRASGDIDMAGGPAALARLIEQGSIAAYLTSYVDIVINTAKRRELIQLGAALIQEAHDGEQAADQIIGGTAARLEALSRRSMAEPYDAAVNWERVVAGWHRGTVRLGLEPLDELTGGLGRGDLVVFAGRTSHGKTSITVDRTGNLADRGVPVDVLTLEETQDSMTRRYVANRSGVSMYKLRLGALSSGEFQAAEIAVRWMQNLPLTVRGLESLRTPDEQAVLGAASLSKAELVVIDHTQKVSLRPMKGENYTYALRRFVDRLHALAIRDRKVVWLNAQLSRETEHRKGPPMLSDILDSSALENAARQVYLLFWPWKQDNDKDPTEYQIFVAKNSEGGTGKIGLRFYPSSGRFEAPERSAP